MKFLSVRLCRYIWNFMNTQHVSQLFIASPMNILVSYPTLPPRLIHPCLLCSLGGCARIKSKRMQQSSKHFFSTHTHTHTCRDTPSYSSWDLLEVHQRLTPAHTSELSWLASPPLSQLPLRISVCVSVSCERKTEDSRVRGGCRYLYAITFLCLYVYASANKLSHFHCFSCPLRAYTTYHTETPGKQR